MLTAKEIFDKVKNHLLLQGQRARLGVRCVYRHQADSEVLKCAVGCLISDETYSSEIEGTLITDTTLRSDVLKDILRLNGVDGVANRELLEDLQEVHDQFLPELWPERLNYLERKHFSEG